MELGWSCNGALSEPSELCQGCNEARTELQWSFAGASVLRWSSAGAAMELSRSCNGASPERRCRVGAAPGLQWSWPAASMALERVVGASWGVLDMNVVGVWAWHRVRARAPYKPTPPVLSPQRGCQTI